MDEFVVGRKAIIGFLRSALDLSDNQRTAWNKILRWRKNHGMEKIFYKDITGRPFIIASEVREWMFGADGQRVPRGFELKGSKETLPEKPGDCQ